MNAKKLQRQRDRLQQRFREMPEARKRAIIKTMLGAQLPEIVGSDEIADELARQGGPDVQAGLTARRVYDAMRRRGKK